MAGRFKVIVTVRLLFDMFMERFYNKIVVDHNDCWNWSGSIGWHGYGYFYVKGKGIRAHRFSYTYHKGEINDGLLVCHSCDNTRCVNPDHLWLGTQKDNMEDKIKKGRSGIRGKRISKGHPSVYSYRKGCRCDDCRKLVSEYHKKWYRRTGNKEKVALYKKKKTVN